MVRNALCLEHVADGADANAGDELFVLHEELVEFAQRPLVERAAKCLWWCSGDFDDDRFLFFRQCRTSAGALAWFESIETVGVELADQFADVLLVKRIVAHDMCTRSTHLAHFAKSFDCGIPWFPIRC